MQKRQNTNKKDVKKVYHKLTGPKQNEVERILRYFFDPLSF